MQIFTIGYTQKSAQQFFELIKANQIDVLIDVRLYNSTQLAGFSKSRDLQYFLAEICGCDYVWAKQFAPTAKLLDDYKNGRVDWPTYEKIYCDNLRGLDFFAQYHGKRICLLCAEHSPQQCHRRLLAEHVASAFDDVSVVHL